MFEMYSNSNRNRQVSSDGRPLHIRGMYMGEILGIPRDRDPIRDYRASRTASIAQMLTCCSVFMAGEEVHLGCIRITWSYCHCRSIYMLHSKSLC